MLALMRKTSKKRRKKKKKRNDENQIFSRALWQAQYN